jgi:hypothetical protein
VKKAPGAVAFYDGKIVVVKITVKEYLDAELQNNIYSIEALDVDLGA